MNIVYINADERFSTTSLSDEVVDGFAGSFYTKYKCSCGTNISFKRSDFKYREVKNSTNLSVDHALAISHEAEILGLQDKNYLDWYCPACKCPIRVYFDLYYGGKSDEGVHIIAVLEIKN